MSDELEFVDAQHVEYAPEDVLYAGQPPPRWLAGITRSREGNHRRVWTTIAVVLVLGAGMVARVQAHDRSGLVVSAPPLAGSSMPVPEARSTPFTAVLALAHQPGPLVDFIRQTSASGACVPVRVGDSPSRAIAMAAKRVVPDLESPESGRIIDQFTDLCALELRAGFGRHSILTMSVSAPSRSRPTSKFVRIETGITTTGEVTTEYASATTTTGWVVLVGVTGPLSATVPTRDLLALAQLPALTW